MITINTVVLFQEVSRRSLRHHILLRSLVVSQITVLAILCKLQVVISLDVICVTDQVCDTCLLSIQLDTIAVVLNNRNQTESDLLTSLVNTD